MLYVKAMRTNYFNCFSFYFLPLRFLHSFYFYVSDAMPENLRNVKNVEGRRGRKTERERKTFCITEAINFIDSDSTQAIGSAKLLQFHFVSFKVKECAQIWLSRLSPPQVVDKSDHKKVKNFNKRQH